MFAWTFLLSLAPLLPQHQLLLREGVSAGEQFGSNVCSVDDLNADGIPELLIGSKWYSDIAAHAGRAQVLSGKDGAVLNNYNGSAVDEHFGSYVSALGDLNQDGIREFAIGAKGAHWNGKLHCGIAIIYSGVDGHEMTRLVGDSSYDFFGQSIASVGDLNGDGVPEFVVGARQSDSLAPGPGYVRLFDGASHQALHDFLGDNDYDWFGKFIGGPGDINQDGYPDILVGAKGDDNQGIDSGSTRLFSGKDYSVLHQWDGTPGSWFGTTTEGAGDVNGDGFLDILIGAYRADSPNQLNQCGALYIFSGLDYQPLHIIYGESSLDWFSKSAIGLGDINGDGCADFASGAYRDDNIALDCGSVRVYSGLSGKVLYTMNGREENANFGYSVASAGDLNRDGILDLLVGSRNAGPTKEGAIRAFSMWTLVLEPPSQVVAGTTNTLRIHGGTPNARIYLTRGNQIGVYPVPVLAANNPPTLDIGDFQLPHLREKIADPLGKVDWPVFIPAAASGRTILLQAFDGPSKTVSNLLQVLVP